MLVEAAHRLNIKTVILDAPNSPAKQINALHPHVDGSFSEPSAIRKLATECDLLTVEIEHVDTQILQELEEAGIVEVSLYSLHYKLHSYISIIYTHNAPSAVQ
jgi:phosphoribosylaminoimidazole carboxylase